ncbi:hypothetical protein Lesp02_56090 [Lentzea sp. NBRC 105346]|uniref:SpoIIE family protein phosphatase n=1 Tax=Lentzea sp. NBRC 105346 TaxID=3032205 RepID=UPI0024A183FE|nr:SpoIIE family protein phosphatase [Lentzea sp. NBRC 105346]GLZ33421.1 hypothetical protein Lesp02_56090 [Lentzea sp. NBRC 105346]
MSDRSDDDLVRRAGDPSVIYQVFEQMPLMVCALEGPDHRFVAASHQYRAFTARENVVGMLLAEAFPEAMGQQIKPILDRVYATGQPEHLRDFRAQMDLPDQGGYTEVFVEFTADPRRGHDGEIVGVTVTAVDVTEQVRDRRTAQRRTAEAELRYEQARDVIDALQRELLPDGVPVLPRMQIAASYLLADADTAAGGDWFDALHLSDGRVALVVGDVVGHGVTASATMGQLRILLHEWLATTRDIVAALRALDAAADRIRGARAATVCVVMVDPATGALEYCTAGHPPPLVLSTAGEGRYLAATAAGPVGVGGEFTAESVRADRLAPDELVLLYTDGILERPGRELAECSVELLQAAADIAADRALRGDSAFPAERVCTQTLELLTRVTGHDDDITLLAGQRLAPPPDLELRLEAVPEALALVHERLEAWLADARIFQHDAEAVRHAAGELATNAIEHAYIDSADPHSFTVAATLDDTGHVRIQVSDQGRWREPAPSADRGLGLQVAEHMVDTLRIEHDGHGTTATASLRLSGPARLLTKEDLIWTPMVRPTALTVPLVVRNERSESSPRIRVEGPVHAGTAAEFDRAVRTAGSTGTSPLTVDLTGVTHLASAGVAALHELTALHRGNDTELRLYAPAGTPADVIMSLVRLPHDT